MRRRFITGLSVSCVVLLSATPALACGGLIGPTGAVNLTRTTTLAAHVDGVEHYVTSFEYAGGGGEFGSIVPLPAMPSKVEKGGAWTLQRLRQETEPQGIARAAESAGAARASKAEEVYKTRIDALDITVLKGGGRSVGVWAAEHGFRLPPDAPEVLEFYAKRSPFFMAAVFDSRAAEERGQRIGDGTPIHVTIPLANPWVPLRILALGKQPAEGLNADVYLLTERTPNLLPTPEAGGYTIERQVPASVELLRDLRSDRGMQWLPLSGLTLTHLQIAGLAPGVSYDLATNVHGGAPSRELAGLPPLPTPKPTPVPTPEVTPQPTPEPRPTDNLVAAPKSDRATPWPLIGALTLVVLAGIGAAFAGRRMSKDSA